MLASYWRGTNKPVPGVTYEIDRSNNIIKTATSLQNRINFF